MTELPPNTKWAFIQARSGATLLALQPREGYVWEFCRSGGISTIAHPAFSVRIKNPKDKQQLAQAAIMVLESAFAKSRIIKPNVVEDSNVNL